MFDSAFADWMPGRPALFGFPFHGRVDWPRIATAQPPILTLPNAQQIQLGEHLGYLHPGIREFEQTGNVIRFKDPRSTPPERSPDELAADATRGIEWRDSALVHPRTRTVHGLRLFGNDAWWVYSDGETVWGAYNGFGGMYLYPQPTISRRPQPPRIIIPIDTSGVVPNGAGVPLIQVVIDAVPDGSRVLIARFGEGLSTMPAGAYATPSPSGKAWYHTPLDFVEIEITRGEDGHQAVMRSVFTEDDVAGTVLPYEEPELDKSWRKLEIGSERISLISGTYTWRVTLEPGVETAPEPPFGVTTAVPQVGEFSIEHGFRDRIVGAYYRPDGSVASVTVSRVTDTSYTGTPLTLTSSQTAVMYAESSREDRWELSVSPGVMEYTYVASKEWDSATALEFKNDGVVVERATFSETLTETATWSASSVWWASAGDVGIDETTTSSRVYTAAGDWAVRMDGQLLKSAAHSSEESSSADGVAFLPSLAQVWGSIPPPAVDGPWSRFRSVDEDGHPVYIALGSVSYCALMPAACALAYPAPGDSTIEHEWWVGNGSLPFSGGLHTGFTTGTGPMTEIFGSYNPVTGQFIRDAANPVSWV